MNAAPQPPAPPFTSDQWAQYVIQLWDFEQSIRLVPPPPYDMAERPDNPALGPSQPKQSAPPFFHPGYTNDPQISNQ